MSVLEEIKKEIKKIEGPIVIFGAGGFIGANLYRHILSVRNDVYAVTSKPFIPWRLDDLDDSLIIHSDITKKNLVEDLMIKYRFKTIFNLAAYGAYSSQEDVSKIYQTNLIGLNNILEASASFKINSIVHAGSSSEYGLNCDGPDEDSILIPNSHYAVSKVACTHLIKYYGTVLEIPVVNLRYYSIYGPYEDPDRLIPKILSEGFLTRYPKLVDPEISRDFVYIDDAILATLKAANADYTKLRGHSINIASGIKTTIREVVDEVKKLFDIPNDPEWGSMQNKKWDLKNWYGQAGKAEDLLGWSNKTKLAAGLKYTNDWQQKYSYPLYEKKLTQDKIKHKLTAIIACYKDEQAIPYMYERLTAVFRKIMVDYEIIFVNDASPDNASIVLQQIVNKDDKVIAIEHSRNFGSQAAFLSGMEIATGDGIILLDGDLQDPPELIESFYEKWQDGYEIVYGRRVSREGNKILVLFYKIFYRIFRSVSYVPIPLDAGDFSLMDKKVVNELVKMPETDQFLRGLRAWVGFKQVGVDYVRPERMFGTTTNNWRKNISWARKAIFSFSYVPLEILTYTGVAVTILSLFAIIIQVVLYLFYSNIPHGVTTIICLILFFGGLNMLAIAILGEYQAKILEETKKRPKYIRRNIFRKIN